MQSLEFDIYEEYLSKSFAVVFHDVLSTNLLSSFKNIKKEYPDKKYYLLNKTTSGMGLCVSENISGEFSDFIQYFCTSTSDLFNFNNLMIKNSSEMSEVYFKNIHTKLKVPNHPQL